MKGGASMRHEGVAAIALLAMGLATAVWMQSEAMRLTSVARAREQQLEHLRTLSRPGVRLAPEEQSLLALRGLFGGHEVEWLATGSGPVLTVVPRAEDCAL